MLTINTMASGLECNCWILSTLGLECSARTIRGLSYIFQPQKRESFRLSPPAYLFYGGAIKRAHMKDTKRAHITELGEGSQGGSVADSAS